MRNPTTRLFSVMIAAVLSGCATPSRAQVEGASHATNGDDCAVIAAVAREHYQFGPGNVAPPLKLDENTDWKPDCDWSRYGVSFPEVYGAAADGPQDEGRPRIQWVEFKRPRYDSQGALIEAGIVQGPRAGIGVVCRVRAGVAGWTVSECRNTWIS